MAQNTNAEQHAGVNPIPPAACLLEAAVTTTCKHLTPSAYLPTPVVGALDKGDCGDRASLYIQ